ncbi:MAG TPA: hypothetical protein VF883_01560 [Thermoanaerobaculia bacterium]
MPTGRAVLLLVIATLLLALPASAALTIEPITWNVIGLDSNDPATGPNRFPVGARVCSDVATTNVDVDFVWDSANPFINLRTGSLSSLVIPSIGAGGCEDAYFEVEVTRTAAAFDTTRRYHITAADGSGTVSTPTPRQLYVEHLISQSRNSITEVKYGTDPSNLTTVPAGGSMALVVGNTYTIQLTGGTATQGYNQFEAFINFSNTVFQILEVETTYSANNSPYVSGPAPAIHDQLYADACLWENDPNSPNYRVCVGGDFKSGGSNVVTTYTIQVISGGGTSETLTSLLYDFSGSSYHYNADYETGARIAAIIDPATATIDKSFAPNPAGVDGITVLTFTLSNPNGAPLGGYNFVDNLPANLEVAATPGVTTNGCGTPSVTAVAGSSSISFSDGTVAANGTCTITVNITPAAVGSYTNTTNNLFVGTVDTGDNASAPLTVNTDTPGTGFCGQTLASWTVPNGTTANPPDLAGGIPTVKAANVATATASALLPAQTSIFTSSGHIDTTSWRTWGFKDDGQYVDFTVDTQNYTSIQMSFWVANPSPANGPTSLTVQVNNGGGFGLPVLTVANPPIGFTQHTINLTGLTSTTGTTVFRIAATGANADTSGAALNFDDIAFTGCIAAVDPTLAKSFSPDPIAVNGVSTLTFTLTNPNAVALTGAAFSDSLPSGVQVAATPSASTTCAGATWAPTAGATTLTFSTGTIPASGSCTASVNVTATTGGPHTNVSGFLSTTEGGTASGSVATATLTAVLPPVIDKTFITSPIIPGGTSTIVFSITNPNQDDALSGVAFSDTFPGVPGAMVVAAVPNASTSGCGAPAFAPGPGAGSISFSGGTIAAGGTCIVEVDVTAPTLGTYTNTTGNVSHIINGVPVNGNTGSDTLEVVAPSPSISLLKQVGASATGPWSSFLATPTGGQVYYRFTIENTGDVPLTDVELDDDTLNVTACNATVAGTTLPAPVAANENHIVQCVVGPITAVTGLHTNEADVDAMYGATEVESEESIATYATTGLTLAKSVTQTSFTNAGDPLNYSYLVTNSGAATLSGPVTVADDKATVTCPALTTVGDLDNFFDPGEAVTCTAQYFVTAGDVTAGFVTNTATASAQGVNSNSDSETVVSSASADISVTKNLDTLGPYAQGQSITYTIVVSNAGPSIATGILVTDTPSNLAITGVSGACTALPCTITSLAVSASANITVTATIIATGAFDNAVTVDGNEPDPDPTDNFDNTGNNGTAGSSADVSIDKTLVTAGPFSQGDSIQYTLTIANAGPSPATSIDVTDTPTNLSITGVSGACAALPCTIASLAAGSNTSITVTATITATGTFDNVATAIGDEPDPTLENNTDSAGNSGVALASANVSIEKTLVTAGPYTAGQSITYTLFVENAGPSTATSIDVTDTPTNLTITGVSGACVALPCDIASLTPGANATITVTATIVASGAFDNVATANADEPDPDPTDNIDNTGNGSATGVSANISVIKTLTTAGPFSAGQSVTYTLFVENKGPSTATSIDVTDTPSNLTITGVSGACVALPCTIASLAVGANTTITVTAAINAAGAFDNVVTVDAFEPDTDTTDNTDNTGNNGIASPSADVSIVKTLITAGPYTAGQSISYSLTVANAGPSPATNIDVTDTPANLSITAVSGACVALPCTIASLGAGANTVINVTATIVAAGAFDNVATANGDEPDPDPTDNTDNTGNNGVAVASANVSIEKTLVTAGPYTAGQSVTYSLVVGNAGPSVATNVDVTDAPTNLTITAVSGACAALPCTIASLGVGANTTITVTATIVAAGAFDNVATANGDEPDPDPTDNIDSTGNNGLTGVSADVVIVKTLTTAAPFTVGQSVTYTLQITNEGPSVATNVDVTDTPTNLTITSVSGACVALPCTIASLAVDANANITVVATINAAGAFDNAATANGDEPDPTPVNNDDDDGNGGVATVVATSVDVSIVKTASQASVVIGQPFDYTLVVRNNGAGTATGVVVTDILPAGFQLISVTTTEGTCSGTTTVTCTIGTMLNAETNTITIRGQATTAGGMANTATVTGNEPDPVPANNVSTSTVTASPTPAGIPTASELGLVMLVLMLALAGAFVMKTN